MTAPGPDNSQQSALPQLAAELLEHLGPDAVYTDPEKLRTYECDGLTAYRVVPGLAALPSTPEDVRLVVRRCAAYGIPFVARGSGTGLSGGAPPHAEGSHRAQPDEPNPRDRPRRPRGVVEPGVVNLGVSRDALPYGDYYAPDPSSQRACTIGGNVAENSGGAHCLKYGFTANHVIGLEVVLPDGELV